MKQVYERKRQGQLKSKQRALKGAATKSKKNRSMEYLFIYGIWDKSLLINFLKLENK